MVRRETFGMVSQRKLSHINKAITLISNRITLFLSREYLDKVKNLDPTRRFRLSDF